MKFALAAVSAAALIGFSASASAQTAPADVSVYGNVGYTGVFADVNGDDLNVGGVTGRLGAKYGRFVGVEAEYTFGVQDDDVEVFGTDVNVELDQQYAGYVVGYLPLSPQTELFARLGYGKLELEAEAFGVEVGGDTKAVAYGAGAQHFFDGVNGVRGEYTRYDLEDDGGEVDSLAVSYVRKF